MGTVIEYFKMAIYNIRANKMRSLLTMLGIIIGISSVVTIFSCGTGIKNGILSELSMLTGNYFEVTTFTDEIYTPEEMDEIVEKVPHVTDYMYTRGMLAEISNSKGNFKTILILNDEHGPEYDPMLGKLKYGSFYTKEDCDNHKLFCVLSDANAKKIFGHENVVGTELVINVCGLDIPFTVKGVLQTEDMGSLLTSNSAKYDAIVYAPMDSVYANFDEENEGRSNVIVFTDSSDTVVESSRMTETILKANHNDQTGDAVYVYEMISMLDSINLVVLGITAFICMVAAISLLVGGIGVMNIMLVSVTERTKEIGIRKSIGARTSSILWQFLIESGTLSLTGGIIGLILGYLGGFLLCTIAGLIVNSSIIPSFNPAIIMGVVLFSVAIGIFFGIYPARKAARLTPIDALRHR